MRLFEGKGGHDREVWGSLEGFVIRGKGWAYNFSLTPIRWGSNQQGWDFSSYKADFHSGTADSTDRVCPHDITT